MKRSDFISKIRKDRLVRRCLALLMVLVTVAALASPGYDTLPTVSAANEEDGNLLAHFTFDNSADRLKDSSGKNVEAKLMGVENIIGTASGNDLEDFFGEEDGNTYLDLSKGDIYLSLTNEDGSGVLAGMAEVTVEMRVLTTTDTGPNWAFFAAPNGNDPDRNPNKEHYLGILLNNDVTVERYANYGSRQGDANILTTEWTDKEWHTIRVVFEEKKTTLYIDGVSVEKASDKSLADCLRDNGVLWFGHASWKGGEGFNGYIDDIQIKGTPYNDITPEVEDKHIIKDTVADPANTVVNMFDYWVFGDQIYRDYGWGYEKGVDAFVNENSNINYGHLFLFDGSAVSYSGDNAGFGKWNLYDYDNGSVSVWGIVQNKLKDGYPQLALDTKWEEPSNETLKELWRDESAGKKNESLAYLFDPEKGNDGKASYPNVTGLFQIDNEGYYYFRSQQIFAELNKEQGYDPNEPKAKESKPDANKITLYNTPWLEVDTNGSRGQFFPFNDWTDLFYEFNGNLVQRGDQAYQASHQPMNHWFGMTIETKFMQPTNGMLNPDTPMTFEFSGDDDVWIFIDDVLVADVGGNHGRIRVTIDYSTGDIKYYGSLESDGIVGTEFKYLGGEEEITLRAMFETALGDEFSPQQWNENTFADGTMHTLKFFYLERGNAASNCNIRFNLQEPIVEHIRKVDQNGDPLEGAKFVLYKARVKDGINIEGGEWWHTASEFEKYGDQITTATIKKGEDGYASLATADGDPIDWTQNKYYILEETGTPEGYRNNPPIVLQYHDQSGTLTVVNKYETGAYASFLAEWKGPKDVYFANYSSGKFSDSGETAGTNLADGLAIVVPVVKSWDTPDGTLMWRPMYGSNTYGWNIVAPDSGSKEDLIKALAEAAIMQIADSTNQDWYLRWDGERLNGYMENLPGDATRYVFNDGNDGDLVTLFLPREALKELGLSDDRDYKDDDERYIALRNALKEKLEEKDAETLAEGLSGLNILYTDEFIKNNRTVIYIPNEQRELRVRKVDENGNSMEGAVFALFDTAEHAAAGIATTSAGVLAYGTTGRNGELIFRANGLTDSEADYGYAKMKWDSGRTDNATAVYWLKEITAPEGYGLNKSLIRVEVGDAGIYANATGFDSKGKLLTGADAANDGITVEASLGRLDQTMAKYAEGIVDETLKYITITKQTANSGAGIAVGAWDDAKNDAAEMVKLTYGANGYAPVIFTADNGYIRVMPRQTQGITNPTAKRDILTEGGAEDGNPINLDGLFSLINTVVVTDMPAGSLTVTKTVVVPVGEKIDTEAKFVFTVTLSDTGINGVYGDMTFKDGVATFTLKHNERKTAKGLPLGITYTVAESDNAGYTVTKSGYQGTITRGSAAIAAFTNTRNVTSTYPGLSETSEISGVRDNVPRTGDNRHPGLWLAMLALSLVVMGMSFRTLRKKRFLHEEEKHLK